MTEAKIGGEQNIDEKKLDDFWQELDEFNDQTNNFISMVSWPNDEDITRPLVQAIHQALDENHYSAEDRYKFWEIWYHDDALLAPNFEFSCQFLRFMKQLYTDLQNGKYLDRNFTTTELNG